MRKRSSFIDRRRVALARKLLRFRADCRGATAIEFAMVAAPFFAMVLAIMVIGMQFLVMHFLEHGVAEASRKLRTGEAQKAGITLNDFRKLFCDAAGGYVDCDQHLVIHVKNSKTFAGLGELTPCVTNGQLTPSAGAAADGVGTRAGGASDAVVVLACYEWAQGGGLWRMLFNLVAPVPATEEGKVVLSAVSAFRSEPFQ
ncbi:TadE/TadG family type IV pilus assembly protein [Hyphomicrobium sp.]|uniref:TadE/TadG family type IV pilus assembly protein n=1 Tax=Hyphomicrobium sp. TaxID=82 RepID=UPI002E3201DF|nr:TadE/TadG family type IV pilus assembly protein [Hyphomicrobium sp.]HEX2842481.1 TadE/TadG family type IV pilus assembly protein [Hyphomicrobium sp.]